MVVNSAAGAHQTDRQFKQVELFILNVVLQESKRNNNNNSNNNNNKLLMPCV